MIIRGKDIPNDLPVAQFVTYEELMELKKQNIFSENRNLIRPNFDKGFSVIDIDNNQIYIIANMNEKHPINLLKMKEALYSLRFYMLLYDIGSIILNISTMRDYIHIFKDLLNDFDYDIYLEEGVLVDQLCPY
jgi:hypothetical protein